MDLGPMGTPVTALLSGSFPSLLACALCSAWYGGVSFLVQESSHTILDFLHKLSNFATEKESLWEPFSRVIAVALVSSMIICSQSPQTQLIITNENESKYKAKLHRI